MPKSAPPKKPVRGDLKAAKRTSEVAEFVKAAGRKAQKRREPNDRHVDPEHAKKLRRMPPEEFYRRMRGDDED